MPPAVLFLLLQLSPPEVRNSFQEVDFAIATTGGAGNPAFAITLFAQLCRHLKIIPPSITKGAEAVKVTVTFDKHDMRGGTSSFASRTFQLSIAAAKLAFRVYQGCRDCASDQHSQKGKNNDS